MKYIIEFEDEPYMREDGVNYYTCKSACWYKLEDTIINRLEPYIESNRKIIEDEVWKLADYIVRMGVQERNLCFGFQFTTEVTTNLSYQEAKSLFEKWMKSENEIHVGDEVVFEMAFGNGLDNNMKAVVLDQAAKGEEWCVLTENGCVETHDEEDLCKTGRHFDEVAELLEKMRGEE